MLMLVSRVIRRSWVSYIPRCEDIPDADSVGRCWRDTSSLFPPLDAIYLPEVHHCFLPDSVYIFARFVQLHIFPMFVSERFNPLFFIPSLHWELFSCSILRHSSDPPDQISIASTTPTGVLALIFIARWVQQFHPSSTRIELCITHAWHFVSAANSRKTNIFWGTSTREIESTGDADLKI